jgi:arylsulfatase
MSNEIMHVTDWFTTLLAMAGLDAPDDRVIDGKNQAAFLSGEDEASNRDGFIYWNGEQIYGVKWRNFKFVMVEQKYFTDPALPLGFPHIVNLITDPKEREPYNPVYLHTWTSAHFGRLLAEFKHSVAQEALIPAGAPLDFVPQH